MHLGLLCNSSSTHARKRFLRTSWKILSNFSGISQRIRHSPRRSWNLGLFAAELTPGTALLELQHAKKLHGTKNNCLHAQLGQNLHQKLQKGPKNPTAISEGLGAQSRYHEQKQGTSPAPCTQRTPCPPRRASRGACHSLPLSSAARTGAPTKPYLSLQSGPWSIPIAWPRTPVSVSFHQACLHPNWEGSLEI